MLGLLPIRLYNFKIKHFIKLYRSVENTATNGDKFVPEEKLIRTRCTRGLTYFEPYSALTLSRDRRIELQINK